MTSKTLLIAVGAALLSLPGCKPAAETRATVPAAVPAATAPTANTVPFAAKPNLAPGVEALPRLVGTTPGIIAINASLDRMDAAVDLTGCQDEGQSYLRSIRQPMTGPAFVSIAVVEEYDCGGAYPGTAQTYMTFDLQSGRRLDWAVALKAMNVTDGDPGDPDTPPMVSSPALAAWYVRTIKAQLGKDAQTQDWIAGCGQSFDSPDFATNSFAVYADAETGGLSVAPELPHVIQACGDAATMDATAMAANGVDPRLIEAIAAAHAAGNWAPKD